jgi:drug/metabolite transporter (DMT)-like permease
VLAVAIAAVSSAAVLVRLGEGVHPIALALWRTGSVGLGLLAFSLGRREALPRGRDLAWTLTAGALLALHFWLWFASLQLTTVLRSTLLVCLTPVWAGLMEWVFLRQRPAAGYWPGIGLALSGVGLMSLGAPESARSSWTGDLLALVGGMLSAGYLVVGRSVRQRVAIGPYGAAVCLACGAWLAVAAAATGAPILGLSAVQWAVVAGLALGPQLVGHIGLNYAVRYLPAATVTAAILLEPVGAALLGVLVLREIPGPVEVLGALLALAGVGVATGLGRRAADG